MADTAEKEKKGNSISDLKKFFTQEGESLSIGEFKGEWDQLSDEEKAWFKAQTLQ